MGLARGAWFRNIKDGSYNLEGDGQQQLRGYSRTCHKTQSQVCWFGVGSWVLAVESSGLQDSLKISNYARGFIKKCRLKLIDHQRGVITHKFNGKKAYNLPL